MNSYCKLKLKTTKKDRIPGYLPLSAAGPVIITFQLTLIPEAVCRQSVSRPATKIYPCRAVPLPVCPFRQPGRQLVDPRADWGLAARNLR